MAYRSRLLSSECSRACHWNISTTSSRWIAFWACRCWIASDWEAVPFGQTVSGTNPGPSPRTFSPDCGTTWSELGLVSIPSDFSAISQQAAPNHQPPASSLHPLSALPTSPPARSGLIPAAVHPSYCRRFAACPLFSPPGLWTYILPGFPFSIPPQFRVRHWLELGPARIDRKDTTNSRNQAVVFPLLFRYFLSKIDSQWWLEHHHY